MDLADLSVFALLECFTFLSTQLPPDTVHIAKILMDLANLAVFASLEGFTFLSTRPLPDTVHTA
jgi:hypothetical protein